MGKYGANMNNTLCKKTYTNNSSGSRYSDRLSEKNTKVKEKKVPPHFQYSPLPTKAETSYIPRIIQLDKIKPGSVHLFTPTPVLSTRAECSLLDC